MLTPQEIEAGNKATGLNLSPTAPGTISRSQQVLNVPYAGTAPSSSETPSYGQNLKESAEEGINKIKSSVTEGAQKFAQNTSTNDGSFGSELKKTGDLLETGLGTASGAASTIFSPLTAGVKTLLQKAGVPHVLTPEAEAKLNDFTTAHPELAKNISDAVNVATAGAAGGEGDVLKTLANAPKAANDAIVKGVGATGDAINSVKNAIPKIGSKTVTPEQLTQKAIQDTTPSYSKKLIGEPTVNGIPRVQEGGGVTKGRTVTSTPKEVAAGKELAQIPEYANAKTSLEKFNLIEPEIARQAEALESSLKNENVLRPPAELNKLVRDAVNNASDNSVLLQKTDPIVKNYLRVTNRAISQADGTLAGELKLRQALDNAYDDAGGKYSDNKGLDQIHRAARNAINDDIEAKATNTEVKAGLKKQSDLYKASDVLQDKARAEGGSELERLMKAHPLATKAVKKAASLVGLGEAVHLVP